MAEQATAEALASEDVRETQDLEATSAPEQEAPDDEQAELEAAWERANAEGTDDAEEADEEPDEGADEADEASDDDEADEPAEAAPTDLPPGIRDQWAEIPKGARDALVASYRDTGRKLSDQGRLVQGVKPIVDRLTEASQRFPALMDMKPEQVAGEVFQLAEISQKFKTDPAGTLLGLIDQHGMRDQVARALNTTAAPQGGNSRALEQHIAKLEEKISQMGDPARLQQTIEQHLTERQSLDVVTKFAAEREHWARVEDDVALVLPRVQAKLGEGASREDVLTAAYQMALKINGLDEPEGSAGKPAAPDPGKIQRAAKAKQVNVTSRSGGQPRPLSEREEMELAWQRAQRL